MAAPLYELQGLSRTFRTGAGPVPALQDLTLALAEGAMLGVAGPSGSGKSTLLGILGLADGDFEGRAAMRGRDLRALGPRERARLRLAEVGRVFQEAHLLPSLDLRHNVALPHWKLHGSRARALARADALLEELGLGERRSHDVSRLSGGELQRGAIARALVNDPAVVLADEPTAHLDAESTAAVVALLARAQARGAAVVACSHDAELLAAFPEVLRLRHGRAVRD